MLASRDFTRPMAAGEEGTVDALLRTAFDRADEARLVTALRRAGDVAGEMVIGPEGAPYGYLCLSELRAPQGWLVLAPVAVAPERQGMGAGRRMVGFAAAWAVTAGRMLVMQAEPTFCARCGFDPARAARLDAPVPVTHLALAGPGTDVPRARLVYPKAFDAK